MKSVEEMRLQAREMRNAAAELERQALIKEYVMAIGAGAKTHGNHLGHCRALAGEPACTCGATAVGL